MLLPSNQKRMTLYPGLNPMQMNTFSPISQSIRELISTYTASFKEREFTKFTKLKHNMEHNL